MMDYPKLRDLEAIPTQVEGKDVICLRDPFNYSEQMLVISPNIFFIVNLFDGKHSKSAIQLKYTEKYHEPLPINDLCGIIEKIDSHLFLHGERFETFQTKLVSDFKQQTIRFATHAGTAYESDTGKLTDQISGYFKTDEILKTNSGNGSDSGEVIGIIAPHIDVRRGGESFAIAYNEIDNSSDADVFVILGTAHYPTKNYFALIQKDFETPFGLIETDKELLASLTSNGNKTLFDDEFIHKTEHSIEFQLLFLQYLYRNKKKIKILPILCSSFDETIKNNISPKDIAEIGDFISLLKESIASCGKKVCIIASADLAHIGLRFGDPRAASENELKTLSDEDLQLLGFAENINPEGFYEIIKAEKDRRRICGFPAIYTFLNVINAKKGKLLKYEQNSDNKGSTVTFAGMSFYE